MIKKNSIIIIILFHVQLFGGIQAGKSLLLPGWGEQSLGYNEMSKKFMWAEASIWVSFLLSNQLENSYKNTYENYSVINADVNWSGKNNLYAAHVGNYPSMNKYNETMVWLYGDDVKVYDSEKGYEWQWCLDDDNCSDEENAKINKYDRWRFKSRNYEEIKNFSIAALLVNRIISIFNVLRLERKNKISSNFSQYLDESFQLKIFYHF